MFLVTGINGFVGNCLNEKLAKNKFLVKGVIREGNCRAATIQVPCLIDNIDSFTNWSECLAGVDIVIHLAARVHVMQDQAANPLQEFLEVNLDGTINLAKQAADAGVKRFVYVSSIKVNGEFTVNKPFNEQDNPNPQDPYAVSKYQAEKGLFELAKTTGMEVVIIRPPLVYGAGVKANFLQLIGLVNRLFPLPLASVKNQRSMIYVGNLVDAIITCATHPKAANQLYLVSDNELVSTPQLIRQLARALGKRSLIFPFPIFMMKFLARFFGKSAAVDRLTQSLVIDSSKIRNELDWKPPYTMEQGLKATANWFKNKK